MDIQSYEHKALTHAAKLLNQIFIPFIFMEWEELAKYYVSSTHRSEDKMLVENIIGMLLRRQYIPHGNNKRLDIESWNKWPINVIWAKQQEHQLAG